MLFRKLCPICGEASDLPCPGCQRQLTPLPEPLGLGGAAGVAGAPDLRGLSLGCCALFVYDDISSSLVLALKRHRAMWLVRWLAEQLAGRLSEHLASHLAGQLSGNGLAGAVHPVCLTWIPAAQANRRQRGYDHAELLAKATARQLGLPAKRLLARPRDLPQTRRDRQGRLAGPNMQLRNQAWLARLASQPGASVVLVDDVTTTGSSLRRAAEVLRAAGIKNVVGLTVAARMRYTLFPHTNKPPIIKEVNHGSINQWQQPRRRAGELHPHQGGQA